MMNRISIPAPDLQIDFYTLLHRFRHLFLQEALGQTIKALDIAVLDRQLARFVPAERLKALACLGLRGELVFAVPLVLEQNPRLLGYYRLLLGFSQKAFYSSAFGLSGLKSMEEKGVLTVDHKKVLPPLCRALNESAGLLVDGIGLDNITKGLLDDLTLLTVGPPLRGGANVKKGAAGIFQVFELINKIVRHAVVAATSNRIEIRNAAGRTAYIEFAADPDIVVREQMGTNHFRNVIAIEIKGGTDYSNGHNRIGEAEKSHQKAKAKGYVECWTVVNVDHLDLGVAKRESPSTNRFFILSDLRDCNAEPYQDFNRRIVSLLGLKDNQ